MEMVISKIKRKDQPVIVFSKGAHASMKQLSKIGADVLGIDWTFDFEKTFKKYGTTVALQGNLDPTILYAPVEKIQVEAKKILDAVGNKTGHIFNLGHGIHPDVSPANAKALVDYVHSASEIIRRNTKSKK